MPPEKPESNRMRAEGGRLGEQGPPKSAHLTRDCPVRLSHADRVLPQCEDRNPLLGRKKDFDQIWQTSERDLQQEHGGAKRPTTRANSGIPRSVDSPPRSPRRSAGG